MLDCAIKLKKALIRVHKRGPTRVKGKFTLPTETQWTAIANLRSALMPLEGLTTYLSSENITVLQAQVAFGKALRSLAAENTTIADTLRRFLMRRYNQRRKVKLLSILAFINDPTSYSRKVDTFKLLRVDRLRRSITRQYNRMYPDQPSVEDTDSEMELEEEEEVDNPSSATKVSSALERSRLMFQPGPDDDFAPSVQVQNKALDTVEDEVTRAFETAEVLEKLRRLEAALKTIPASSVECERNFSAIGLVHTKLRNRLSDESIDYISFGKHYMKRNK